STLSPSVHDVVRSALGRVTLTGLRAQGLDPATATSTYGRFVIRLHAIARTAGSQPDTAQIQRDIDDLVGEYTR
ncbi:MAG: hypothetical protein ACXVX0_20500, partial [Blastococcus sp.]